MPALNTPASLSQLRSYVRNLVLERTADTGLITDTEANDLINIAARTLFVRIANKYPDSFAIRSATSAAVPSTGIVPFQGAAPSVVSTATGAPTTGNIYRMLNAYVGATGTAEFSMEFCHPFGKVSDRHVYEPGLGGTVGGIMQPVILPARWYVEGATVVFTPVPPSNTFDARFQWTQMPQDMTVDGDLAWEGKLPYFHDSIAMLTSVMVFSKDSNLLTPADSVFRYVDQILQEQFGPPQSPYAPESGGRP